MQINTIHNCDCVQGMKQLPDNCIDLTVTSPPYDNIISWSNEGDLILDPFMGSGTTAKMALETNRNFIGFEISKEYCEIAEKRINEFQGQQLCL